MPFSVLFFFISLTGIFISNIVVLETAKLNLFLTIFSPFFLFFLTKLERKKIKIPVRETIFYILFILFSVISFFFAIDKEIAFEAILIYVSYYFYFIFAFNYHESISKHFKWFLVAISIFSSLIFLINKIHPISLLDSGAGLFYNGYYHNEVGNVIILGILVCLYLILFKSRYLFITLLLFFLPFFIFSYSRSAYLSLMVVGVVFFLIKKNWSIFILLLLVTGLFFVTTKEIRNYLPPSIDYLLVNKLSIPDKKSFTGKRQQHFIYALKTIKDNYLFGVGPGNMGLATVKYQFNPEEGTTSAHNIILDIIAENGVLAGICFLAFLIFIFKQSKKDLYFYPFLSLTLIFLINFSYRYTSIFLIWVILAGLLLHHNKEDIEIDGINILLPIIAIFIFGQIILAGNLFYNSGLSDLSLKIYSFNGQAYRETIEKNINNGDIEEAKKYLAMYESNFKGGYIADLSIGRFYKLLDNKESSIYFYKKSLYDKPILASMILNEINYLEIDLYGVDKGKKETEKFIIQFKKQVTIPKKSEVEKIIKEFCHSRRLLCQ